MIKVTTAKEALELLRQGKEIYYFDIESKEIAPLPMVLESVPGVFLIEENSPPEQAPSPSVPTALTHYDYGIPIEDDPEYFGQPKQEEPKVKKPRKKKPGKKPSIDLGKVKALHRAGWSNLKIADEMGVSGATIGYHLKRMESEVQGEHL